MKRSAKKCSSACGTARPSAPDRRPATPANIRKSCKPLQLTAPAEFGDGSGLGSIYYAITPQRFEVSFTSDLPIPVGDQVELSGLGDGRFNGRYKITAREGRRFTAVKVSFDT